MTREVLPPLCLFFVAVEVWTRRLYGDLDEGRAIRN